MFFSLTTGRRSTARMCGQVYDAGLKAFETMRAGKGPAFFWVEHGAALQSHQLG